MARKPMITRTIQSTKVKALCLDLSTQTPEERLFNLPRTYKDDKAILETLRTEYETDENKVVHVISSEVIETRYGMTEADFMKNAIILPPLGNSESKEG